MPILELNGVSKSFGALVVAEDIGFSSNPASAWYHRTERRRQIDAVQLITGNLSVAKGTVHFDGRDVTHVPPCSAALPAWAALPDPAAFRAADGL